MRRSAPASHALALALALALGAPGARADVAPLPVRAPSLQSPRPTPVRMEEETVTLRLAPDRASVSAHFTMHNPGETADLRVGFPSPWDSVKELKVSVDGRPVALVREKVTSGPESAPEITLWWAFDVRFPKGLRTRIAVTYWVEPAHESHPGLLGRRWVEYVLRTGSAWKGTIGKARVVLALERGLSRAHLRGLAPTGWREEQGTWVWEWTDFKPAADVKVSFTARSPAQQMAALRARRPATPQEELVWRFDVEECAWLVGDHGLVVEQCDWLIAREREKKNIVVPFTFQRKDRIYSPPELRKARALVALGRVAEAREAARAALPRLEELLAAEAEFRKTNNTGPFQEKYKAWDGAFDWPGMQKGLEEMRRLAASEGK